MRYIGLVSMLILGLLAGYLYMDNRRLDARLVAEVASHQQTKANFRAGQAEARALDAERLLVAEQRSAATNERIRNAYQADLAALRARAERLRLHPEGTPIGGSGGGLAVSLSTEATSGTAGPGSETRLSDSDALIASEQALQLKGLLDWFTEQEASR